MIHGDFQTDNHPLLARTLRATLFMESWSFND